MVDDEVEQEVDVVALDSNVSVGERVGLELRMLEVEEAVCDPSLNERALIKSGRDGEGDAVVAVGVEVMLLNAVPVLLFVRKER